MSYDLTVWTSREPDLIALLNDDSCAEHGGSFSLDAPKWQIGVSRARVESEDIHVERSVRRTAQLQRIGLAASSGVSCGGTFFPIRTTQG